MAEKKYAYAVPFIVGLAMVAGCSSSSSDGNKSGSDAGMGPALSITAPANGTAVSPSSDSLFPDVAISLDVKNFTLKDPGRTDGSSCPKGSCGHVHLLVDDGDGNFTQCNDKNVPYNSAAVTLTGNAVGLDYCPKTNGPHSIKGELHNDDHSPVIGSDGKLVTSNVVSITASGAADGG